jgi:hypothetical protein
MFFIFASEILIPNLFFMKNYRLLNNITGWLAFAIAAVVYLMTIEPTASFWDCGEFISSAYKLEVGHPPGAPIFMLTANLFSQLASDPSHVAMMINAMSAVFSALTILFLFWTITHLAKKIVLKDDSEEIGLSQMILILGAGLVGALAYTFSDTFWFSAVEGEVYAYSSLFTALVFWLILKWESVADKPHADRWIVLIAYLTGLSIGVHLLNLLCIPAIVLVYYFKKYPNANLKGSLIALGVSFLIVALLLYGLASGVVKVCGWFELLFVNVFGLGYDSGVLFYVALAFCTLAWGIRESVQSVKNATRIKISFILSVSLLGLPFFLGDNYWLGIMLIIALTVFFFAKKKLPVKLLNTSLVCLLVILIGYSSYALIMIRSTANTPMDQNSPEDVFTLASYINREQYGDRPLLYGKTYVSEVKRESRDGMCAPVMIDDGPVWSRAVKEDASEKDKYVVSTRKSHYEYMDELNMFFPRMFSNSDDGRHVTAYKEWANIKGKPVRIDVCGNEKTVYKPTFAENLRFFFSYQLGFMYWRYFMWNFSGRQNDIQGHGEVSNGNWITGIKFIDSILVGPQDNLPYDIGANKGHNKYYMLPLLLGILGLFFQAYSGKRGIQGFWITFFLFFMTGIAIVIYLNQYPYQPRERDYAYAGSFYAFCIWVGLGVLAVAKLLARYAKLPPVAAGALATALCLFIPWQMGAENWDDHDRSGRYVCRDFGFNYLSSCEPNSIIFTNGDNDTFPLWYAQEVEGFRTDVRVCNLSYLQTDWYIDQMKRQAYESTPLPISWTRSEYVFGTMDVAYVFPLADQPVEVGTALKYARSKDPRFKRVPGYAGDMDIVPSKTLYINVDTAALVKDGLLPAKVASAASPRMMLDFTGKNHLGKHEMMILEMLNNAQWKRPIYFALTVGSDLQLGLRDKYFRLEGLAQRIVPFDVNATGQQVQTDIMFDNMVHKFRWGGIGNPKVYLDENVLRMIKSHRSMFSTLAEALIREGKKEKAIEALDTCQRVIPPATVRYTYDGLNIAACYYEAGAPDKAIDVYEQMMDYYMTALNWYFRLNSIQFRSVYSTVRENLGYVQLILSRYQQIKPELMNRYLEDYARYSKILTLDSQSNN